MMSILLLLFSISCLISLALSRPGGCAGNTSNRRSFCDTGQFLDRSTCTCRNCTFTCPANQIIRRSCSPVSNSVCGPLLEFQLKIRKVESSRKSNKTEQQLLAASNEYWRSRGMMPSVNSTGFIINTSFLLVPELHKAKAANCSGKEQSPVAWPRPRPAYIVLWISMAAAFAVVVLAAVLTFCLTKRKTAIISDKSLVNIEAQLIWNSRRRSNFDRLLGNDYVKEYHVKPKPVMPLGLLGTNAVD